MKRIGRTVLCIVIFAVAFFLFAPYRDQRAMGLDVGLDALTVTGPESFSFTVDYARLDRMELARLTDAGSMASGGENRAMRWGEWENDAWGEYTMCTVKKTDMVILMTTRDGRLFVFNHQNKEETEELYRAFLDLFEQQAQASMAEKMQASCLGPKEGFFGPDFFRPFDETKTIQTARFRV